MIRKFANQEFQDRLMNGAISHGFRSLFTGSIVPTPTTICRPFPALERKGRGRFSLTGPMIMRHQAVVDGNRGQIPLKRHQEETIESVSRSMPTKVIQLTKIKISIPVKQPWKVHQFWLTFTLRRFELQCQIDNVHQFLCIDSHC
jgi:hypothetical protein